MKNTFTTTQNTSAADLHASNIVYIVKICLLTLITILIMAVKASCADSTHIIAKNAFYIQVAGVGNHHSLNFERIFSQGHNISYSYSVGYSPAKESISVPISLSAFTTGRQHHFDMSLTVIPHVEKHIYSKTREDLDKQLYIKPTIGYRYQKAAKGLFVKVGVGPQVFMDPPSSNIWAFTPKLIAPSAQFAAGINF